MHRVVTALSIAGLILAGCSAENSTGSNSTATESETTAVTSATPSPAPPLTESALDGLLLTPAEVDTATGSSGMSVAATSNALATDIQLPPDSAPEKLACIGIAGTAEAQAYAGFGSTAVRDQVLQSVGGNGAARTVAQSVILFDSPQEASAFVTGSAEKWPLCREFRGAGSTATVSAVATDDGLVTTTITTTNEAGVSVDCQRALTAANNVVVEASACSASAPDAAVGIAERIAAKANR